MNTVDFNKLKEMDHREGEDYLLANGCCKTIADIKCDRVADDEVWSRKFIDEETGKLSYIYRQYVNVIANKFRVVSEEWLQV